MSSSALAPAEFVLSATAAAIGIAPEAEPVPILANISTGLLHIRKALDSASTNGRSAYRRAVLDVDDQQLCRQLADLEGQRREIEHQYKAQFQSNEWTMIASQEGVALHKRMQSVLNHVNDLRSQVDEMSLCEV